MRPPPASTLARCRASGRRCRTGPRQGTCALWSRKMSTPDPPPKQRDLTSKTVAAVAVAILLIAFGLSNRDDVPIDWLTGPTSTPRTRGRPLTAPTPRSPLSGAASALSSATWRSGAARGERAHATNDLRVGLEGRAHVVGDR